jgi:hypothetical protein
MAYSNRTTLKFLNYMTYTSNSIV